MNKKQKQRVLDEVEHYPLPKCLILQRQWSEDVMAAEEVLSRRMADAEHFAAQSTYNANCVAKIKASYGLNHPKAFNKSTRSVEGFLYYKLGVTTSDVDEYDVLAGLATAYISLSIESGFLNKLEDAIELKEFDKEQLLRIRGELGG